MRLSLLLLSLFTFFIIVEETKAQYIFKDKLVIESTAIKDQQRTGSCWSFATCSFVESELLRQGKGALDLSEMFVVRNAYKERARNYVLRKGKASFGQGGLAHDFLMVVDKYGIVPESTYSGRASSAEVYNHSEMETLLKGMMDGLLSNKKIGQKWSQALEAILDVYLGEIPSDFESNGHTYSAKDYYNELGFNTQDYMSITSFSHHPYYESFVLEIPDNYSSGSFLNVKMEELEQIVDHAMKAGYTVAWHGDSTEKTFSRKENIAIIPIAPKRKNLFLVPGKEKKVLQEDRQEAFESFGTTDDHLMHIVGIAEDQNGSKYYKIKNSWGEYGAFKGYMYMSMSYFKLKTISILVHKDALPIGISNKIQ
jgi:bleomycin hydrolase